MSKKQPFIAVLLNPSSPGGGGNDIFGSYSSMQNIEIEEKSLFCAVTTRKKILEFTVWLMVG